MALEDLTGTKYIDDLNSSNPAAGDNVSEGDDHIRGIKNVLKLTFPNIDGAISASDTELNYVDGVTSSIQSQLNTIASDDWVTNARMAVNSVDSDQYVDGSIDTAHIGDDQVTLAKMASLARGKVIVGDSSGNPSALALGTSGYVLKSDGTDISWAADSGLSTEQVQDIAGGMFTSNTETGITATYQDADGTIDLAIGAGDIVNSMLADDAVGADELASNAVVTASIVNDAVTGDKIADNVTLAGNVTVSGNLTVSGDTTTVNTATLAVEDPLVSLATGNNSADAVDIGIYGLYDTSGSQDLYSGLFRDASDSGKWKLFKDNQAAPTTTVNTSGTGYAVGTLVANIEGNVNGTLTAANSVDSDQYVDGSIDTAHLAADAVTGAKIADDAINSEHYTDGSIDTAHIANDQVTADKLSNSLGDLSGHGISAVGLDGGDKISFSNNSHIDFNVNNATEMRLEADGDLHVDGDVIAFSSTISDETLKYDINPVEFALDKINQLKGVSYKYKHNDRESAGLLAQDVEKVMPSAVKSRKVPLVTGDDKEYKTLHYDSMTAILVEAIKELTAKVKKLESK